MRRPAVWPGARISLELIRFMLRFVDRPTLLACRLVPALRAPATEAWAMSLADEAAATGVLPPLAGFRTGLGPEVAPALAALLVGQAGFARRLAVAHAAGRAVAEADRRIRNAALEDAILEDTDAGAALEDAAAEAAAKAGVDAGETLAAARAQAHNDGNLGDEDFAGGPVALPRALIEAAGLRVLPDPRYGWAARDARQAVLAFDPDFHAPCLVAAAVAADPSAALIAAMDRAYAWPGLLAGLHAAVGAAATPGALAAAAVVNFAVDLAERMAHDAAEKVRGIALLSLLAAYIDASGADDVASMAQEADAAHSAAVARAARVTELRAVVRVSLAEGQGLAGAEAVEGARRALADLAEIARSISLPEFAEVVADALDVDAAGLEAFAARLRGE